MSSDEHHAIHLKGGSVHTRTHRGRKVAFATIATLSLLAAACGDDDEATTTTAAGDTGTTVAEDTATTVAEDTATTAAEGDDTATTIAEGDDTATTVAEGDDTATTMAEASDDPFATPNPATGDPIKIGVVADGQTDAIDNSQAIATVKAVAAYANEFLGGLNGHPLEVSECETKNTPAGATTCAVQMVNDGVQAVLVGGMAQDEAFFTALTESSIPYITGTSAAGGVITKPGAYVLTNSVAAIAAPIPIAQEAGVDRAAFVIIDVPAATGPISALATPMFATAGVDLSLVNVSPQVADMTPQLQVELAQGTGLFAITGTEAFMASGVKGLKQLGFEGEIIAPFSSPSPDLVASIPGGLEGVISLSSVIDDPTDPDLMLYEAIMAKYADGVETNISSKNAYIAAMGFLRALTGVEAAVDAASINAAFSAMPEPIATPLGGGATFQCGSAPVSFAPAICTGAVLKSTLDAEGVAHDFEVLDVSEYLVLG